MRAVLTAVVAAIEAAAVALVGMAVVALPALLLWVITFNLAADPGQVLGSALGVWFLAHLSPLLFAVSADTAVGLGLPQQALDFPFSLAPLGLTVLTAALAVRSGWRFGARGGTGAAGTLGGAAGFAGVAGLAAPFAAEVLAWPAWQAVAAAALVYGLASAGGFGVRAIRDEHAWWQRSMRAVQQGIGGLQLPGDAAFPRRMVETLRLASAAVLGLIATAAVGLTAAIVAGYVQIVTLSQALHFDALGAFAVFLLQLALLPVFLIWGASWLSGAGFAIGVGSSASPFESLLGPMPALPLLGAVPSGWGGSGALAPALVVLIAAIVGALFARRPVLRRASWVAALSIALSAAVLAGLACAGLGALAHGAIGPDRLAEAGPQPWLFGGLAAAELGGGLLLGVAAGRFDAARLRAVIPGVPAQSARSTAVDGDDDGDEQETVPLDSAVAPLRAVHDTETEAPDVAATRPRTKRRWGLRPGGENSDRSGAALGDGPSAAELVDDSGILYGEAYESNLDPDRYDTEPYDADLSDAAGAETAQFETAEIPARRPELFDIEQHEGADAPAAERTGEASAGTDAPGIADAAASATVSHDRNDPAAAALAAAAFDTAEIDEEELLRAFSWDGSVPVSGESAAAAGGPGARAAEVGADEAGADEDENPGEAGAEAHSSAAKPRGWRFGRRER